MTKLFIAISTALCLFACAQQVTHTVKDDDLALAKVQVAQIQSHMEFLASDLLEGRETGTRGHELAALYIAGEFAKYGLVPAGDNSQYFQRINFRKALLEQDSPSFFVQGDKEAFSFSYPNDFIMSPSVEHAHAQVSAALVFVGYGIVAPEYEQDDYQNLDVTNKIVVVLAGKPESMNTEAGAHLGSSSQKMHYAAERGAVGMIRIQTPESEKRRPYQRSLNYIHSPRMRWVDEQGKASNTFPSIKASAYMKLEAATKMFEQAGQDLAEIYAQIEKKQSPRGFPLALTVSLSAKSAHTSFTSPNVIGMIEGSDPTLKHEYVIYTAHADHIGIAKSVKKDKINNGAMDNASGTAVLMETARVISQMPLAPKRSILFIALTGEEKGLLGADYFAKQPTVPKSAMVANVNLDMPILTYEFADVIAFGAEHSNMKASVELAAQQAGVKLSPDPWPEQNLFTRSDHYSFVKQGVPAVFLVPGLQSKDPNIDGSAVFSNFLQSHYHLPSDDMSQDFVWQAAETFTKVNMQIGLTLANQANRPYWNKDSFFGNTFGSKETTQP